MPILIVGSARQNKMKFLNPCRSVAVSYLRHTMNVLSMPSATATKMKIPIILYITKNWIVAGARAHSYVCYSHSHTIKSQYKLIFFFKLSAIRRKVDNRYEVKKKKKSLYLLSLTHLICSMFIQWSYHRYKLHSNRFVGNDANFLWGSADRTIVRKKKSHVFVHLILFIHIFVCFSSCCVQQDDKFESNKQNLCIICLI